MLHPQAFASALATASVIFYIVLIFLRLISPPFFKLILNSQFLGADIASQVPKFNLANFLGILIAVGVVSWIFGYLIAEIYNRYSK